CRGTPSRPGGRPPASTGSIHERDPARLRGVAPRTRRRTDRHRARRRAEAPFACALDPAGPSERGRRAMKDRRVPAPDIQSALERLARPLPGAPEAVWRARLRAQFVSGGAAVRPGWARGWGARGATMTAIAAAAALLIVFVWTRTAPHWQVVASA